MRRVASPAGLICAVGKSVGEGVGERVGLDVGVGVVGGTVGDGVGPRVGVKELKSVALVGVNVGNTVGANVSLHRHFLDVEHFPVLVPSTLIFRRSHSE